MSKVNWGTTLAVGLPVAAEIGKHLQGKGDDSASPSSFAKGGMVRKTGMARVHRGERVLTKKQNKKYKKQGCK